MIKVTNDFLFEFELSLLKKIRLAKYEDFDKIGNERVYTAISDTRVLANMPEVFVNIFNSSVMVLCCVVYLFSISIPGGLSIITLLGLLMVFYYVRNKKIQSKLKKFRDLQNGYFKIINDLLRGFKEIKMDRKRNVSMFENFILKNRKTGKDLSTEASIDYLVNELTYGYSWYVVIGFILFGLPLVFDQSMTQVAGLVVCILYMMSPVGMIISFIPFVTVVKISMDRLSEFEKDLSDKNISYETEDNSVGNLSEADFQELVLKNISYEYYDSLNVKQFGLGPLNLSIKKGELVFIIGGNGSGKSTLINIISGLFRPTEGHIYFNGDEVTEGNSTHFRNRISAIFTNNHLFSENYDGFDLLSKTSLFTAHVQKMKMKGVVKFDDNSRIKEMELSKGQQKRLALIFSLLENKDIIILDEWAAEQDPEFRKYFYEVVLHELKNNGKTIVVVTHDDRYFECADRLIKIEYGKITSDEKLNCKVYE